MLRQVFETVRRLDPGGENILFIDRLRPRDGDGGGGDRPRRPAGRRGAQGRRPESRDVVVAPQGTSATIYFADSARGPGRRDVARFLAAQEWAGRSSPDAELASVALPTDMALRVAVSLAADDRVNPHGVAAMPGSSSTRPTAKAKSGSASMAGSAPTSRARSSSSPGGGFGARVRHQPTSLIDIAPTVLRHLHMDHDDMDGRALPLNLTSVAIPGSDWTRQSGLRFIILFGVVSLFADMAYEGARSVTGPFLASLGASGFVVGAVAGLGELLGYVLRLASGPGADRTRLYWPFTLGGYLLQLPAVPALALASGWPVAALLIVTERIGKSIEKPAKDMMLAQAGEHIGRGWGFGVHEAMDQAGALIGPLAVAGVLLLAPGGYRLAIGALAAPVVIALAMLAAVRLAFPQAGATDRQPGPAPRFRYPRQFWWYAAGCGLIGFGFVDYPLIAYHFTKTGTVGGAWIPVFYAAAMGAGGLGALAFGKIFDQLGLVVLVAVTVIVAAYAPLVFFGGFAITLPGVLLWGIGLAVHESVMPAAVAAMVPHPRRGSAYGMLMAVFGAGWFLGSAIEGALYDLSIPALVAVAVAAQLLGTVPIFQAYQLQATG